MAMLRGAGLTALLLTAACATGPMAGVAARPADAGAKATYGGFSGPESAVYDAAGDRYFIGNAGAFGPGNDAYISILNPDGTVAVPRWVAGSDEAPFANALGTAIHNGSLYVCDGQNIRVFDMETAQQTSVITVSAATFLNDLSIASNGTIYVSNTGQGEQAIVYRITPDGTASPFVSGEVIQQPNGVELDGDGALVVVGIGFSSVQVYSTADASLLQTYPLPVAGNDGIAVLPGSYIVSSVTTGNVYEVDKATGQASLLAEGVTSAASIGYDTRRDRVVIPRLQANLVTFLQR